MLSPETAVRILECGGGLRLPVKGLPPETMVRYARAAKQGGARLELVVDGAMLMPDTLMKVSLAGGGMVVFDYTGSGQA